MRSFLLGILLVAYCHVGHAESICERVLRTGVRGWSLIKAAAKDVRDYPITRPYRDGEPSPKWYGVSPIRENHGYFRKVALSFPLIVFGPRAARGYELTPFKSGYEYLARRPFGWITQKVFGKKFEPACIPRLIIAAATSACLATASLEAAGAYAIWSATPHLAQLIRTDLRYSDLMGPEQAFIRQRNLVFFYRYMALSGLSSPYFDRDQRFEFVYRDLDNVFKFGVPAEVEGFLIPPESQGPLAPEKKMKLIHLQDALYIGYQSLAEMFDDARPIDEIKADRALNPIRASLYDDLFIAQLLEHRSPENLHKAQEYLFWLITFKKYDVIGIKKLKPLPNGAISAQPMTIADIFGNEP